MIDPIENIVENALLEAGIKFTREHSNDAKLDFYLTDFNLYIECKAYHSDRANKQLARAENIILVQGKQSALFFASILQRFI